MLGISLPKKYRFHHLQLSFGFLPLRLGGGAMYISGAGEKVKAFRCEERGSDCHQAKFARRIAEKQGRRKKATIPAFLSEKKIAGGPTRVAADRGVAPVMVVRVKPARKRAASLGF